MVTSIITGSQSAATAARARMVPYAASIFASALILFLVQPMIARELLPRFGGAASVWTACLMFFQLLLLLGYLYAHWSTTRLSVRTQGLLHAVLVGVGALAAWRTHSIAPAISRVQNPALGVLVLLAATVGLPYFVLSSTSPLLQSWCAAVEHRPVPYRLYALSNLGSLLALVAYPFAIEPVWDLATQFRLWRGAYAVFAVFAVWAALRARGTREKSEVKTGPPVPLREALVWAVLAACPSALLMAVTNELCQNLAPVPLLWIAPLALYLATFILCFDRGAGLGRPVNRVLVPAALAGLIFVHADAGQPLTQALILTLGGFFVITMFCHGELAERKREGAAVTSYYLSISAGGAAGGLFVGLLAPVLFSDYFELQIACAVALVLMLWLLFGYASKWFLATCATLALVFLQLLGSVQMTVGRLTFRGRNFYGTLAIRETPRLRSLIHGKTIHGSQLRWPEGAIPVTEPTTYYGRASGAGIALSRGEAPQRVGAIGLGAGTIGAYGRRGDYFRFYEINPMVEELARTRFDFLKNSRAAVEVRLGDGRLSLESEPGQGFDTLVVDAFSGDSIPVHLLTRESFQCYFRHLKPDGVLAVHVSNHYLELAPLVARLANAFGRPALRIISPRDDPHGIVTADWVLISANRDWLAGLERRRTGQILAPAGGRIWTDQYSNILSVLRH